MALEGWDAGLVEDVGLVTGENLAPRKARPNPGPLWARDLDVCHVTGLLASTAVR
jgi:hypothetical protein